MDSLLVKEIIEKEYNIQVSTIEKVKNTYKINGINGYCLKVINYDYPHFSFIISAIKHLEENKFENIIEILKTKDNKDFIKIEKKNAYLTRWINAKESNFDDLELLENIGEKVSELHIKSRNFLIPEDGRARIGWRSWIKVFETRKDEICDFKNRIHQKAHKNEFDKLYLESFNYQIYLADKSIERLKKSNYLTVMDREVMKMGFCHHDLANHNILIEPDKKIKFIDFDYCILDSNLHDLASLIWRANKFGNITEKKSKAILKGYERNIKINTEDVEIMKAFLSFPQEFWQIGLQVYWEQQPWGEEFMINKLNNYLNLLEDKIKVIELINV